MLLGLSGKIYSRLQGPRGHRMHMREVYLEEKKGLFLLRRGEMMVSIMKQFIRISWLAGRELKTISVDI